MSQDTVELDRPVSEGDGVERLILEVCLGDSQRQQFFLFGLVVLAHSPLLESSVVHAFSEGSVSFGGLFLHLEEDACDQKHRECEDI